MLTNKSGCRIIKLLGESSVKISITKKAIASTKIPCYKTLLVLKNSRNELERDIVMEFAEAINLTATQSHHDVN